MSYTQPFIFLRLTHALPLNPINFPPSGHTLQRNLCWILTIFLPIFFNILPL
ncbi:hypothetical protein MtrunA17_Chr6g0451731 [Medicago truncatula]|uniref:Uncharacterized protein n=1 Tax=Medicago truncatula TaxID=3880 RepID=A0A396HDM8_MEDTR|nr:hypothetical protein MtrunA17_Chr6g0451731 [Medicago truncatula]